MKIYKINDVTLSETELRKLIKENPELKEEKRGRWKPENENYWIVDANGRVDWTSWMESAFDNFNWQSKNCFKTEKEARKALERQEAINTVTLAIEEANEGWVPDWENGGELKYYIYYEHANNRFRVNFRWTSQDKFIIPYIKKGEMADQIIENYEEELRLIFELD